MKKSDILPQPQKYQTPGVGSYLQCQQNTLNKYTRSSTFGTRSQRFTINKEDSHKLAPGQYNVTPIKCKKCHRLGPVAIERKFLPQNQQNAKTIQAIDRNPVSKKDMLQPSATYYSKRPLQTKITPDIARYAPERPEINQELLKVPPPNTYKQQTVFDNLIKNKKNPMVRTAKRFEGEIKW